VIPAPLVAQSTAAPSTSAVPSAAAVRIPGDSLARPISLEEAVRLAQRNAPAAVQARGTLRSNAAAVRSAYAAFIPTLNVNLGGTRQGGDRFNPQGQLVPFTGEPWQYSSGFSTQLDVFDGGSRFFDIKSAKANVGNAEANEVLQKFNVALSVKQQYFNVLASRESYAAALIQLEQAQQQLRASAAKVAAGAATMSDSLRSVIQVGNARLAMLTAENNLRVANASLTRLIASPVLVTANPADTGTTAPIAADSVQLAALAANGPAVLQAQSAVAASRAASRAARAPYLPTVSLTYNRGGNGSDNRFGFGDKRYAYSNTLRFSLQYPLFNQLTREEGVVRADVAQDNAEAQLRDTRLLAQQSLVQYLGALRTAEERVSIQVASVAAAEEDLRVQQRRYELGASTLLDVLTSQLTLNQARASLIQARYDMRVARAQIEALIGKDLQ
jgi:outer membrane protein